MLRNFARRIAGCLVATQHFLLIGAPHAGALSLIFASAGSAAAGDAIVTKALAIPFAGPAYNWNGFYAGGRVGYAWGSSNWTASSPGAPNVSGSIDLFQPLNAFNDTGSFTQGLQAGYNYMLPNRIVIGAEADVTFPAFPDSNGISIGGTSNLTSPLLGPETYSETVFASGTVRGRLATRPVVGCFTQPADLPGPTIG